MVEGTGFGAEGQKREGAWGDFRCLFGDSPVAVPALRLAVFV
ncbi:hypothetical protein SLEP1_g58402 [Rubroshorea leprosula]|uniref:Uncharacterized protein n=1 Tax=Rubroshorea leprosula TaxID=152421 RepID=A0AAV5MTR2_9ROSI|nr:hypothetical protein SLEP1_g58402 [Rubroshorea leprosula]